MIRIVIDMLETVPQKHGKETGRIREQRKNLFTPQYS